MSIEIKVNARQNDENITPEGRAINLFDAVIKLQQDLEDPHHWLVKKIMEKEHQTVEIIIE